MVSGIFENIIFYATYSYEPQRHKQMGTNFLVLFFFNFVFVRHDQVNKIPASKDCRDVIQ